MSRGNFTIGYGFEKAEVCQPLLTVKKHRGRKPAGCVSSESEWLPSGRGYNGRVVQKSSKLMFGGNDYGIQMQSNRTR